MRIWRRTWYVLKLCLALGIGWIAAVAGLVFSSAQSNPSVTADAAIVMGAAAWNGRPSPVLQSRLDYAAQLFLHRQVKWVVVTGGTGDNDWTSEGAVAAEYLIRLGLPETAIIKETQSRNSYENLCLIAPTLKQLSIETLAVVTDPPHVYRSASIARSFGFKAKPAPIDRSRFDSFDSLMKFYFREIWYASTSFFVNHGKGC